MQHRTRSRPPSGDGLTHPHISRLTSYTKCVRCASIRVTAPPPPPLYSGVCVADTVVSLSSQAARAEFYIGALIHLRYLAAWQCTSNSRPGLGEDSVHRPAGCNSTCRISDGLAAPLRTISPARAHTCRLARFPCRRWAAPVAAPTACKSGAAPRPRPPSTTAGGSGRNAPRLRPCSKVS